MSDKVLAKQIAKEVIEEMKQEKLDKRLHNTRLLMRNYNTLKAHVEKVNGDIKNLTDDIEEFEYDENMDLLDEDEIFIRSMLRTKMRTAKMLACIEESLEIIKIDMDKKREMYKFKAFTLFFIGEKKDDGIFEKKTNEEISELLNCGKNTPKKWSDEIIAQLNVLLWGVEALGI
ncbi:hypothetical protein CHF27_011140 [Romboutsia maritimum]|uniref:Uncharacterized protein n=1 Tax=Romboutsia maritimum TaxID=2020948 RepID=A0A371IQX6_9FIRM|nr:hypothetical protein [Romboutsia maritimum]RDY22868.1 hypothetical protein CHF27_011140 [Romboutsia maritimum]